MIRLTRRTMLASLSALVAIPARSDAAWPNRPISLVHGFAAGGATDTVARIMAEGLTRRLGQQVVVDPRPGASGTAAAWQAARAVPDGYTLIAIPGGHATAEALFRKLPYKTIDDFSMISMVSEYPFVFVTYADHKIRTAVDLIHTARSQKTPLLYGSPGIGSVHHLAIELMASMANVQLQHVPYRGSAQAVTDLLGKRIDFMIDPPTLLIEFARAGKLRPLADYRRDPLFQLAGCADHFRGGCSGICRYLMAGTCRTCRDSHINRRSPEYRGSRYSGGNRDVRAVQGAWQRPAAFQQ